MTGLKSGSGDDLWGDDSEDEGDESVEGGDEQANNRDENAAPRDRDDVSEGGSSAAEPPKSVTGDEKPDESPTDDAASESSSDSETPPPTTESLTAESATSTSTTDESAATESTTERRPYIVRRAVQDKSVQFEREERLTFFVHDDVVDGERNLLAQLESSLGRDVPKFDVREAVYRAALRNPEDVLEELLNMGYSADDDS